MTYMQFVAEAFGVLWSGKDLVTILDGLQTLIDTARKDIKEEE